MKNPNGFGSCIKLSGNRRKPWGARITIGYYENGNPKYKFISYHKTKKEAFQALCEYSANPYEIKKKMALQAVYDVWKASHEQEVKENTMYMYAYGWQILEPLYKTDINLIKLADVQKICDESGRTQPSLKWTKTALKQVYTYAYKHEICDESKLRMCENINISKAGNPNKLERLPFTMDEISTLWRNKETPDIDILLILLYTGVRISELLNLANSDIHLEDRYFFIREGKTASAVREVPIAECLVPFVEKRLQKEKFIGKSYNNYLRQIFNPQMDSLNMKHHVHDTRHTFISLCTQQGADERILKKIVGHKAHNVTENVYTHIDLESKLKIVNALPFFVD